MEKIWKSGPILDLKVTNGFRGFNYDNIWALGSTSTLRTRAISGGLYAGFVRGVSTVDPFGFRVGTHVHWT